MQSGFLLALVANLIWGTTFIASKETLSAWGPFTASSLRFLVAIGAMAVFFPIAGYPIRLPQGRKQWILVAATGFCGFGLLYPLQLTGLTHISSALSAAIMLTSPLFVTLLGALLLGERISQRKLVAIGLGIAGGSVLLLPGHATAATGAEQGQVALGIALTVAASACLAASVIFTKRLSAGLDPASLTFWSMSLGLILMAPFALNEKSAGAVASSGTWMAIAYLALICSVGCFVAWNQAIRSSSPKAIASTMHVKTPVAVLLGAVLGGESVSLMMITGTALVTVGVWLSQTEAPKGATK